MGLRVDTLMTGVAGAPYYNRLVFTGTTQTDAQNAADAVSAYWQDLATAMVNDLTITVQSEVTVFNDVTGDATGLFTVTGLEPFSGGSSVDPLPWATQGLIRFRTGVYDNGREIRGRMFVPGMKEDLNTDGRPVGGIITDYNTKTADFITAAAGTFGIWSKKAGTVAVVSSGSMWTEWGSLRSRRD